MRVLFVGAHPDDIELGCAGMLASLNRAGVETGMVVCSSGSTDGPLDTRITEQQKSCDILGVRKENFFLGSFLDAAIPTGRSLVVFLETCLERFLPDIVFIPWPDDTHQDHRAVAMASLSATRRQCQAVQYETLSSQNFGPSLWHKIDEKMLELKVSAIEAHTSQNTRIDVSGNTLTSWARNLAAWRGIQSCMFKFAEGFVPVRMTFPVLVNLA